MKPGYYTLAIQTQIVSNFLALIAVIKHKRAKTKGEKVSYRTHNRYHISKSRYSGVTEKVMKLLVGLSLSYVQTLSSIRTIKGAFDLTFID